MDYYSYTGPVEMFGKVVEPQWKGVTYAATPAKAKSNLAYQWKKAHGRTASSRVELPGKVEVLDGRNY